jgi:hypothetical protein
MDYEQLFKDTTPAALQERRDQIRAERALIVDRHLERLRTLLSALVLTLVAVMVMETPPKTLDRLTAARHTMLTMWITITLVQPTLLRNTSALFVLMLITMALFASHIRLGRRPVPTANP